ncbi:MAG: carbon-nitrogen hydrolase family protein [Hydromonas sp.]|nr:carbon-nitrogen hydrolase family protein [Hydromonas sp.]MBP6294603.1 carbon-nitrogen hydrolase family protein [Hydromonas sp.]
MQTETLVTACVQMVSGTNVANNLKSAEQGIAKAANQGANLVILPEYFCIMGQHDTDKVAVAEDYRASTPDASTPIQLFLQQQAIQHGIYLIGGTLPLKTTDADKVYNTTLVYAPDGAVVARYDKIHLFGFQNGLEYYDESTTIMAGELAQAPVVWDSPWGRIGLSICYDVRFPELYRAARDVLAWVNVAAFTQTTGQAHWELLMRARAVENQCYVIACGQGGEHENGRRTFGHSMIVDAWGIVQAVQSVGEGVVMSVIKPSRVERVRTSIPALQHRVL